MEDNREWGKLQPKIKRDFLKNHVAKLSPDVTLCLDMDEVMVNATKDKITEWISKNQSYVVYIVNLWEKGWRKDWSFWNVRLFGWEYLDRLGDNFFKYKPMRVHCGLAPEWAYSVANHAPFIVEHYGLKEKENRQRKVERYKKYDPQQKMRSPLYYQALETDYYQPYNRKNVVGLIEKDVNALPQPLREPTMNKNLGEKHIVIREADGFVFEVQEKYLSQQLNQRYKGQGFRLLNKKEQVKDKQEENDLKCKECGFEAKNAFGLRSHLRKHQ